MNPKNVSPSVPISACSKVLSKVSWPLLSASRGMHRTHKAAVPFSSGSLSCSCDDAGLPSKKKEKSNLLECPGNFSHTSVSILNFPSSFHLTQKICRASIQPITVLTLVMGLPWQLVTKLFCSVGKSSFWLRELLTDLCSDSQSDIPLSQRGQQPEETEINGKTWALQLLGR